MSKKPPVKRPVDPVILRFKRSENLRLRMSVDEQHNHGRPINRDFDLPAFDHAGQSLTDGQDMRQGIVMTCQEHLAKLHERHPGERALAFCGNGNLLANYTFVAWQDGHLYGLDDEPLFRRKYTAICCWREGQTTVEEVSFARENGSTDVFRTTEAGIVQISDQLQWCTTGQPLVRGGREIPLAHIAEQWYDVRHVVSPLVLRVNGEALFFPTAQLQAGLLRKAVGAPLHLRLETKVDKSTTIPLSLKGWLAMRQESPDELRRAGQFMQQHAVLDAGEEILNESTLLKAGGWSEQLLASALAAGEYREVEHGQPQDRGEYQYVNGHLNMFLHEAIYPHNIFVRWADETCGFVLFPGKSGREGTTLSAAQQLLHRLGVQDAVLLDNGADVRLWYRGRDIVPTDRPETRSLLAVTVRDDTEWTPENVSIS